MKKIILLLSIISLQSCQSLGLRKPSSSKSDLVNSKVIENQYAQNVKLDYLLNEKKNLVKNAKRKSSASKKYSPSSSNLKEIQIVNNEINISESSLNKIKNEIGIEVEDIKTDKPVAQWAEFKKDWHEQKEKLFIKNPNHYALKDGRINRTYQMGLSGTTDYQLGIVNKTWTPGILKGLAQYFEANIKCDSGFKIKKSMFANEVNANQKFSFKIYEQKNNSPSIVLFFDQKVNYCDVYFRNPNDPEKSYGIRLLSNTKNENQLSKLENRFETCIMPDASELKGVEELFLTSKYKSMTCAENITDIKTLEEPIDGLKAKVETLIGKDISDEFIKEMNPYGDIDFSNAPKLNTILISYLVFRHDFYGTLIARLIKWHADHGTLVRIMMSDVISLPKDQVMLQELAESSNNIKLQEFRYESDGGGLWDQISEIHKTVHVKLFITLADNPINNVVYIGGRNIHDGFVFMGLPDHSAFPELVQYGKGKDEGYAPWRDYEMRIRSKRFAEQVATHYLTLWQRDSKNYYVRSINQNIVTTMKADPGYFEGYENNALIRHFISVPYKDDEALEDFYIDIFNSAEKVIRLSTPYFRPTKKLGEAIERAIVRGVEVSLITRIDLKGDTADIILSDVNKSGINQFLKKIKIYEYTETGVILHSKVVLVDNKLSVIGSVNLNKRSFIYDMENAVMIYNPAYNKKMNIILDEYLKQTREVTEKQKIALWKKVVIGIFDKEF